MEALVLIEVEVKVGNSCGNGISGGCNNNNGSNDNNGSNSGSGDNDGGKGCCWVKINNDNSDCHNL